MADKKISFTQQLGDMLIPESVEERDERIHGKSKKRSIWRLTKTGAIHPDSGMGVITRIGGDIEY